MKFDLETMCIPFPIWKQIQMSNKMMQLPSTTRILELLHIDLMGPMQAERLEGVGGQGMCLSVLMTAQDSHG